jgi:hypothetical protein
LFLGIDVHLQAIGATVRVGDNIQAYCGMVIFEIDMGLRKL